ncbi:restriction endonuclease subunit S [Mycoplasma sp. P36-A1]|uniref:restriction endonuclease subunit S n=1 Tax=Mycoplasma sp. P36-A1 TaxID=3252900 RepID=UPI003C3097B6
MIFLNFSNYFVDKSFRQSRLGDECIISLGGTPSRSKPEYWSGTIPWINSGEINKFRIIEPTEKISELGLAKSSTKLLPAHTTVLAITGATLGQVSLLEIASCTNQSVVGVQGSKKIPYTYIYPFIIERIHQLIAKQTGGAQQHINKGNVEELELPIYDSEVIEEYNKLVNPLFNAISNNCFEIERLVELRDTLLPKLMSGELSVTD